ncbi:hypothetical protein Pelo_7504 [Pelomyxa schiedti]|nr:hypothetical protein Pelo_7504 [Pelomyxa schiedti]
MQRAQVSTLTHFPDFVDNNPLSKYDRPHFMLGWLVCRYVNSNTLVVGVPVTAPGATPNIYSISSSLNITALTLQFPYIITCHQAETLQLFNVKTRQAEQYIQERDSLSVVRGIFSDSRSIIAVFPKKLMIWQRDNLSKGPQNINLNVDVVPTISAPHEFRCSTLPDNRLLLVNTNPSGPLLQVWDVVKGEIISYIENRAKSPPPEAMSLCGDYIITSGRDAAYIWDFAGKSGILKGNKFGDVGITAIHADTQIIILGTSSGHLSLHTFPSGNLFYNITRFRSLLLTGIRPKIVQIQRVGRWIVCQMDNNKVEVYDLFQPETAAPLDGYIHPIPGVLRDVSIYDQKVYLTYSVSAEPNAAKSGLRPVRQKPDVVLWSPKLELEGFEFYASEPELNTCSCPEILIHGFIKVLKLIHKLQILRGEDLRPFINTVSTFIPWIVGVSELEAKLQIRLPFMLYRSVVVDLDDLEFYALKLLKQGVAAAAVRALKVRERLDDLCTQLTKGVLALIHTAEMIGDVRSLSSATFPSASLGLFGERLMTFYSFSDDQLFTSPDPSLPSPGLDDIGGGLPVNPTASATATTTSTPTSTGNAPRARRTILIHPPREKRVDEEESSTTAINELILDVMDSLSRTHAALAQKLSHYDHVCSSGINDVSVLPQLVDLYARLKNLTDDIKETAKSVAELRGDNPKGQWWEGGGGSYLPNPLHQSQE